MLIDLVARFGADRLLAHHQAIPEDWSETIPYTQAVCDRLGVRLVCQQIIYAPRGDGIETTRQQIIDVRSPADVIPWGTPGAIAGVTDLALRRGWPPSSASRFCTSYFKRDLLNAYLRQMRQNGIDAVVALGERAAESPRRARKVEWMPRIQQVAWSAWNWLPVHSWSRRQVFRYLRGYGIEPHPAYAYQGMTPAQMYDRDEEGGPRTSCRGCIFATQADICHQAQTAVSLGVLRRIADVERATGRTWWAPGRPSMIEVLAGPVTAPVDESAQMRLF